MRRFGPYEKHVRKINTVRIPRERSRSGAFSICPTPAPICATSDGVRGVQCDVAWYEKVLFSWRTGRTTGNPSFFSGISQAGRQNLVAHGKVGKLIITHV